MNQIYAYTGPTRPSPESTPYVAVFVDADDGGIDLTVRGRDDAATCHLPVDAAGRLHAALEVYSLNRPKVDPTTDSLFTVEEVWNDGVLLYLIPNSRLPPRLYSVAKSFEAMARSILDTCPRNPERTKALNALVEAKDCAVRAALDKPEWLKF